MMPAPLPSPPGSRPPQVRSGRPFTSGSASTPPTWSRAQQRCVPPTSTTWSTAVSACLTAAQQGRRRWGEWRCCCCLAAQSAATPPRSSPRRSAMVEGCAGMPLPHTSAPLPPPRACVRPPGTSSLVRVAQSAEPSHFAEVLGSSLVIHSGERPAHGGPLPHGTRLYHVKGEGAQAVVAGGWVGGEWAKHSIALTAWVMHFVCVIFCPPLCPAYTAVLHHHTRTSA